MGDQPNSYDPAAIEEKWRREWDTRDTNVRTADQLRTAEHPYYNLMMFPYPSAEGLHVGNMYAFTGADVHGRFHQLYKLPCRLLWHCRHRSHRQPMHRPVC